MTHFERTYLLQNSNKWISNQLPQQSADGVIDLTQILKNNRERIEMQQNYRELDRLTAEFEKELNSIKALRAELERYKAQFSIAIEDEATKKIQEVLEGINKMFK